MPCLCLLLVMVMFPATASAGNTCAGMWGRMPSAVAKRAVKAYGRTLRRGDSRRPQAIVDGLPVGAVAKRFESELARIWDHAERTKIRMYCDTGDSASAADAIFNTAVIDLLAEASELVQGSSSKCQRASLLMLGRVVDRLYRFGKLPQMRKGRCSEMDLDGILNIATEAVERLKHVRLQYGP